MRNIWSKIKLTYRSLRYNHGQRIRYYNFWTDQRPEEMWLSCFIRNNFPNSDSRRINITSVLGPDWMMKDNRKGVNIFYTGENIHNTTRFSSHQKRLSNSHYDLYIDFDSTSNKRHIRIPIWLLWCFPPDGNRESIVRIVNDMRFPKIDNRRAFCCMVSSHDWSGLRGEIMDQLSKLGSVSSAGTFRHNTDALKQEYGNDKVAFMRQFRFAICPENSNSEGYVTEKIFDAFLSGCIPIYHGSNNHPEPEIINRDSVVFWEPQKDNTVAINTIQDIMNTEQRYREFANIPRLLPNTEEHIFEMYYLLKQSLSNIL